MATVPGICNVALQMVKVNARISALDEGTKLANACDEIYAECRDYVLRQHVWNFAIERAKLAQISTTPTFEWDHAYRFPADFIRLVSVHEDSDGRDRPQFKIEGGKVMSDADALYMKYVARITDPNRMTPDFRQCLSRRMAIFLATSVTNSATLSQRMEQIFWDEDLPRAKSADSISDGEDYLPESMWVAARLGNDRDYEPGEPT